MFAELLISYAPALVAAVVLVPAVVVLAAMLFEGAGQPRWGEARREPRAAFVAQPPRRPVRRAPAAGAGGLGFRRVTAAPQEHE